MAILGWLSQTSPSAVSASRPPPLAHRLTSLASIASRSHMASPTRPLPHGLSHTTSPTRPLPCSSPTLFSCAGPLAQHANLTPAQGSDRWLAPEVLVGGEYDLRADVFSYAMTMWEVATCEVPFASYSTRQAAMLIAKGYRPILPPHCPSWEMKLMACCNAQLASARPTFSTLLQVLEEACDPAVLSAALDPLVHAAQQAMAAAGMTILGEQPPVLANPPDLR